MTNDKTLENYAGLGLMGFNLKTTNISARLSYYSLLNLTLIECYANMFSPDLPQYPIHPNLTYVPNLSARQADSQFANPKSNVEYKIEIAVINNSEPCNAGHTLIVDGFNFTCNRPSGTSLLYQ